MRRGSGGGQLIELLGRVLFQIGGRRRLVIVVVGLLLLEVAIGVSHGAAGAASAGALLRRSGVAQVGTEGLVAGGFIGTKRGRLFSGGILSGRDAVFAGGSGGRGKNRFGFRFRQGFCPFVFRIRIA